MREGVPGEEYSDQSTSGGCLACPALRQCLQLVPKRHHCLLQSNHAVHMYCFHGLVCALLLVESLMRFELAYIGFDAHTLAVVAFCVWATCCGWKHVACAGLLADLLLSAYIYAAGMADSGEAMLQTALAIIACSFLCMVYGDSLPPSPGGLVCCHSFVTVLCLAFNCSWVTLLTVSDPTFRARRMLQFVELGLMVIAMAKLLPGCVASPQSAQPLRTLAAATNIQSPRTRSVGVQSSDLDTPGLPILDVQPPDTDSRSDSYSLGHFRFGEAGSPAASHTPVTDSNSDCSPARVSSRKGRHLSIHFSDTPSTELEPVEYDDSEDDNDDDSDINDDNAADNNNESFDLGKSLGSFRFGADPGPLSPSSQHSDLPSPRSNSDPLHNFRLSGDQRETSTVTDKSPATEHADAHPETPQISICRSSFPSDGDILSGETSTSAGLSSSFSADVKPATFVPQHPPTLIAQRPASGGSFSNGLSELSAVSIQRVESEVLDREETETDSGEDRTRVC